MSYLLSDEVMSYALVVMDPILVVTSLVGMVFVIQRREYHPLKERSYILVLLQSLCMFFYPVFGILDVTNAIPCWASQSLLFANYCAFGCDLVSVTFRTFFKMRLLQDTTEILSHEKSTSLKTLIKESWFIRHSALVTDNFFAIGIILTTIISTSTTVFVLH